MTTPIVIFGAGGFAREVLQIIQDINAQSPGASPWHPMGFVVDSAFMGGEPVHGLPILGSVDWLALHPQVQVVVAVGAPSSRRRIAASIEAQGRNTFATLVHPRAWVGRQVEIGPGSVICAGSLITTDIRLGRHVHVNIGSTIGHDATLGDFVTLNPSVNVSGNVVVGQGCEIGTGSVVIPRADLGDWSIVGAGSVVTKPLPANVTAVGAPARVVKTRVAGWQESIQP
jgi:sugar O-acyltransferase (sialic acid O-acetyltransferase NeuD family)